MTELTSIEEIHEAVNGDNSVVLFTQPSTCAPCRQFKPHFEAAGERSELDFYVVDLDNVPEAALEYGLRAVPTVVLFSGGESVSTLKSRTAPTLLAEIDSA